jgi:hypothetical protein
MLENRGVIGNMLHSLVEVSKKRVDYTYIFTAIEKGISIITCSPNHCGHVCLGPWLAY